MIQKKDPAEIYDAALSVFADYGFKKATLNDIAILKVKKISTNRLSAMPCFNGRPIP
jgi:hypothetical protein